MTEEGMKTFEVSVFEYNVVDVGMEGTLVFRDINCYLSAIG